MPCVAVPLTTERETGIAAALSITMPTARTDDSWPHGLYPPLREAAQAIRAELGLSGALSPRPPFPVFRWRRTLSMRTLGVCGR